MRKGEGLEGGRERGGGASERAAGRLSSDWERPGRPHGAALLGLIWTVIPLICKVIVSNDESLLRPGEQVKAYECKSTIPPPPHPPPHHHHHHHHHPSLLSAGWDEAVEEERGWEGKNKAEKRGIWREREREREDEVLIKALLHF